MVKTKKIKRKSGGNPQINVRIPKELRDLIDEEIKLIANTQQITVNAQSIVLASIRDRYEKQNQAQNALPAV
jgi:hypothetical protein